MENLGKTALADKLNAKRNRVNLRYDLYDMKHVTHDPSPTIPPNLKEAYKSVLGWCGHAVDAIADRLVFENFTNDLYGFNDIFKQNNPDIFTDSLFLGALITSCDFVYISPDADGFPRLQVIDGGNATGRINPVTGLLYEGYAVIKRDEKGQAIEEAYFDENATYYYKQGKKEPETYLHNLGVAMLVPVIYKPDAKRPFGHSVISRSCMSLQAKACQTLTRTDITAEFYAFPQKYILGTDPDAERLDTWRASMSTLLEFTKDEDGDHPTIGQFASASMTPHVEQFKMIASAFAGETGLTLDDLGFPSDNPSSYEAIKASHVTLGLKASRAQRCFGSGLKNVGFVAACLRDGEAYKRSVLADVDINWYPIFGADVNTLSGVGDAIGKLATALPDYITEEKVHKLTGI